MKGPGFGVRGARFGVIVALLLGLASPAAAQVPTLRGLAFEESLDEPPVVAPAVPDGGLRENLPLVVHLRIDLAAFEGPNGAAALDRLGARLQLYKARKIPVVLVLGALPTGEAEMQAWSRRLRLVAEGHRGSLAGYEFGAVRLPAGNVVQRVPPGVLSTPPAAAVYAFAVKQASVLLRSIDPDVVVALGPLNSTTSGWLSAVYGEGIAPYVDAIALLSDGEFIGQPVKTFGDLLDRHDPTAALWSTWHVRSAATGNGVVEAALRHVGTRAVLTMFQDPAPVVRDAIAAASRIAGVLGGYLVTLDASALRWLKNGAPVTTTSGRLLYSTATGATFLIFEGFETGTIDIETDVSMTAPALLNPYTGAVTRLTVPARERGRPARLTLQLPPQTGAPLVVDFNYGQASIALTSEARQASLPPVEEIIARHQGRQAAQDAALKNYVGHLRIEMHFHLTPAEPAYNVITENRVFAEGAATEWVEESFSLNGATWKENRPGFPLLQPEKVMSLPLDLRLNQDYRYRLEGVATVGGREAYQVTFTPTASTQTLYRGTVWIDRASFARLKVSAVQVGGSGVVQANEEEQLFTTVGDAGGQPIWLLTHLTNRQTLLVAGRTILNEREVRLTDVRMNLADFDRVRASARATDRIMYRDTAAGVRHLVKRGDTRVVSENMTTSARAFAMGANIDPSFDVPLPIAGFDILDFNFLGKDLQLALLFGGVIGFGNIQKAGLLDGRLDASVDFFGIAIKGNDAVFDDTGERTGERLQTLPASVGLNVGYRLSPTHKVSGRVELSYLHYSRAALTAAAFTTPSSTVTTGQGVGYEFRRRGYSVLLNASAHRRKTWAPWGFGTTEGRTYTRFDAGLSKDFIFNTFHTVHVNGQYFGGRRLDRFSMYQFGMFDAARMHGVPTAVRFAELAMLRGSYSFNLFEQYRLDLFLDHAIGRRGSAGDWQRVTGMGAAVSLRGPRNTILRADIGRSILPNVYKGVGSTVVQILILKPL